MKHTDIVNKYRLDLAAFTQWLPDSGYSYKTGFLGGHDIDEAQNIDQIVGAFKSHSADAAQRAAREKLEIQNAAQLKQQAMANMLITSGFNFEGYTVEKYSGYISGDDAVQIDRGTSGVFSRPTDVGASLMASLSQIRRNALNELKEAAFDLGCNAVIGVDFDYLTLDPQTATSGGGTMYLPYVFGVTANGNAVVIKKQG